ncbi:MAG: phosphoenolpyruvate-protein phosphotransferase [Gammaproteobacteria bacterium BRH_c0]|nr:MAG: phosphoenolpyruvate-protein phosphotransferase [Gammaproteobacteria bacterium BRH_c0]
MLDSLRSIVQEVNSARDFGSVLDIIVKRVRKTTDTGVCSIYLHDPVSDKYILAATEGLNPEAVGNIRLAAGEGLVGLVAAKAEPINLDAAESHPNFAYFPESGEERFRSFLGAPVIHHRKVLGVLVVQQAARRRFDESEEAFLVTVSAQLAGVIAHASATGQLTRQLSPDLVLSGGERVFRGVASVPGISIGHAVAITSPADLYAVPHRAASDIDHELALFHKALEQTKQDLRTVHSDLSDKLNMEERALFDVYVSMLDDSSLGGEVTVLIRAGLSAQTAWSEVIIEHIRNFTSMEDAYLRERATDVRDLGRRVLGYLQQSQVDNKEFPSDSVLIGEELAAANLADISVEKIVAMVSAKGSRNSHLAILGRAMGIPTVMGAIDLPWRELDGNQVIVDGHLGLIIANPRPEILRGYMAQMEEEKILSADLERLRDEPSVTADNQHITLWVNTGLRLDSLLSLDRGAEGVGLYRTEIPFFMQERFPSEDEQRKIYREQMEMFAPRPVTMRTLDIGGDKALPYFPIEEANPFLGWRGIRISLDHPDIFLVQLRAIMRASEGLENLRILLPMISNIQELESALALVYRVYHELTEEEGYTLTKPLVGAMIEVPAAVYQVQEIARRVDFLSVGSNDLTQYLLAVDRNNPRVADLYHTLHPALLQALKQIVAGAREENCPVSICGEMAGDPLSALLLVGLGYRVFSMSATNLLRVKAILRQVTVAQAEKLAEVALTLPDNTQIREYLESAFTDPEITRLYSWAKTYPY